MANKQAFVPMATDILTKEIVAIGKVGNKLNARIQSAALNAVYYSVVHGDIRFGNQLLLAMNKGLRKNSLVAFLEKYGKFQWSKENKSFVFRNNNALTIESIEAIDERWFETIKAPEPVSMYDFETDVTKFIKRMEKAVLEKATIKHVELMDYIKSAIDQYHDDQLCAEDAQEEHGDITEGEMLTVEQEVFTKEDQEETGDLLRAAFEGESNRQPMRRAA